MGTVVYFAGEKKRIRAACSPRDAWSEGARSCKNGDGGLVHRRGDQEDVESLCGVMYIMFLPPIFPRKATNSFDYKKFFEMLRLKNKSLQELNMFFSILDTDKNGYLEPDEIQLMLQDFSPNSRHLTDKETQEFMGAGDKDEDGKIGIDEFIILVNQS
ncbi:parvalbumin alpha isoform 2-T2 [Liasis olivaceus]